MNAPIALVNSSKKYTGVSVCMRLHFEHLVKLGFNVKWYQFADRNKKEEYMQFPEVLEGSKFPGGSLRLGYDRLIHFPAKSKQISEDYVFLADPTMVRLGLKKKAFMVMVHDLIPLKSDYNRLSSRPMFKYAIPLVNMATTIIVPTDHIREQLEEFVEDKSKVFVVSEPAEFTFSKTDVESSIRRVEGKEINLFLIAADRPHKNIRFFLELASYFQKRGLKKYTFTLVSELGNETKRYLDSLKLKNLKLIENTSDISRIFNEGDVLVNPSVLEGFGRPVLEAMALGKPVIASDIAPFRELLSDSATLLSENSIDSWANAILSISSPKEYTMVSNAVRARFEAHFSEEKYTEKLKTAFVHFVESCGSG